MTVLDEGKIPMKTSRLALAGSPLAAAEVLEIVSSLKDEGLTVLLVEQNVRQALRIADRAYVLEAGRMALSGVPEELLADERLLSAYLGSTAQHGGEDA